MRVVVLVSGRGTNLDALLDASKKGRMRATIVRVVSSKVDAPALGIAMRHGIETTIVPATGMARDEHERLLIDAIDAARPDLVVLAGYMRILGRDFIERYAGRLVNIHPSLLPAFPGMGAQKQAHAAGVRIAGCTTHFVTAEVDGGPIIAQAALAVDPNWSAEELATRILALEHTLYPTTIDMIAQGEAKLVEGRVAFQAPRTDPLVLFSPRP